VIPRIVDGYVSKFLDEAVLLRQVYIRDENLTVQKLVNQVVASLGENIVIRPLRALGVGRSIGE